MQPPTVVALATLFIGGYTPATDGNTTPGSLADAGRCPPRPAWLRSVQAGFRPLQSAGLQAGWTEPDAAALAFYEHHEAEYQATDDRTELAGFLLRNAEGRYLFTNAVAVPYAFRLRASIDKSSDWPVVALLHTHPGGRGCQEEFSSEDRDSVLRGAVPASYVRTPLGHVRFLDPALAAATAMARGATGASVCADDLACLAAHRAAVGTVAHAAP